jgi:hypothetical protein
MLLERRVVDQDVEAAELGDRAGDGVAAERGIGDVP